MPPKQTDSQVLPNKEQALFRQLIKQYEVRQNKQDALTFPCNLLSRMSLFAIISALSSSLSLCSEEF